MAEAQIYIDLKRDHDKQRDMLKQLGELAGASEERQSLFEAFRVELQGHAAAEEESLYATMLGDPELRDDARHSVSEHKEVDDLIGEMSGLEFGSDAWSEKFFHMRRRYEHHITEEEEEMFPAAAKELSDETEARLAEVYEERKPLESAEAKANPPSADERE
jgi:hemerythrin-like domain-containing protein